MIEDKGHQERPISRVANKNYRDNWDRIHRGKKDENDNKPNSQPTDSKS